ncbi:MAG: universal stress protein [Boseongicola sp.]|nr:universal stress protein [Boseongicola sp.]MDE0695018.1 universal stress protein [Boseongicola sp.]
MKKSMVILDDSRECLNAMRFAAIGASKAGGGVQVLAVIPPEEFQHWIGVGEIMREEARERIHAHFEVFARWMRDRQEVDPELVIREGEAVPEILAQIEEDGGIGLLVLGASADKGGPGPIVTALSRRLGSLPVPLAIVPGELSREELSQIW